MAARRRRNVEEAPMLRSLADRLAPLLAVLILPALLAGPAPGQTLTFTTSSPMGRDGGAPPIASTHLDRYADVLGLDEGQRAVADDLFETFGRRATAARVERDEQLGDLRAEARESGDFSLLLEEMPEIQARYAAEIDRLRARFFGDLRLLLTPEQEARWGELERVRRRLETIGDGTLSGESVDLIRIVEDLSLPAEVERALAPTMERYAADLDRALIERNRLREASEVGLEPGRVDLESIEGSMDGIREASEAVRAVNERYARVITGVLPEDEAARFDRAVRRASFPSVYREPYALQAMRAALELDDLDADQRAELERLLASYERDLDRANDAWASAIAADEANRREVAIRGPGGSPMRLMVGEASEEVEAARDARRDLNRDALARVRGLLTPEQRDRLPERDTDRRLPSGGGRTQMMFVERSVRDADGDGEPEEEDVDVRPGEGGGGR